MQKITLVTPFPERDLIHAKNTGVGSYSSYLAKSMAEEIEVDVWSQKGNNLTEYIDDNQINKIEVKRVWDKNIFGIFQIVKKVWQEKPEIIHIQHELNIFGGTLTVLFSPILFIVLRMLGIKVVTTMHGGFGIGQIDKIFVKENGYNFPPFFVKIVFYFVFGLVAHFSNKIIVHENWQKEDLIEDYKISKNKIFVIPHGVPDNVEIIENAKEKLNLQNKKVFLYMGFAAKYKGLPELFDLYKEYIKKGENKNTILIVGAGPAPRLENDGNYIMWYEGLKMKYESLGEFVKWVGFIPSGEVATYYSASDAVLFPYSRRLAASGPMAIAIGYEKDIILSSILKGETEFKFDFNDGQKTAELKKDRIWEKVAEETIKIYKF